MSCLAYTIEEDGAKAETKVVLFLRSHISCGRYKLVMVVTGEREEKRKALFAHGTLRRTFCAIYGTFRTWNSQE